MTAAIIRSGRFGAIPMCDKRDKFCEKCTKCEFRRPHSTKFSHTPTPHRGAKWHVDLAGPFRLDRNGHPHTMNMVDDCTGYFWGTTPTSKSNAITGLREFIAWLKPQKHLSRQTIPDINCLPSDRGGEFTSGPASVGKRLFLFGKICEKLNILRYFQVTDVR